MDNETDHRLRVDFIPSATVEPVITVKEKDTLERAASLMRLHNFSQLPVMRGKRAVGIVSWRSIGQAMLDNSAAQLSDCVDRTVVTVKVSDSLIETIDRINEQDYVLVAKTNDDISGIITSADLGDTLASIARPYLLISQCEEALRGLIRQCLESAVLSGEEVAKAMLSSTRTFDGEVDDLPFGDLVNVLKTDAVWEASSFRTDAATLRKELNDVAQLRNEIMHFRKHSDHTLGVRSRLPFIVNEVKALSRGLAL